MPIVRVGGSDAESFDVAEMTDDRNWASPPPQSAGISSRSAKVLSPMPEIDDSTSTISSSRRTVDDIIRTGPAAAHGIRGIRSIVVYADSNNTTGTSSSDKQQSRTTCSSKPLYEDVEQHYVMHHDPRNPFETPRIGHHFIQEEDETSLSTMDDSFISPCLAQQSSNNLLTTRQSWLQSQQKSQSRSYRHHQKYQSSIPEPVDDTSVPSIPSNQGSNKDNSNHQKSSQSITVLESQVAKLNFELATTKSSLDELKLENRNLQQDKTSLSTTVSNLQKENDRLRVHIVRLEKEKMLRNIEGTKGVAVPSMDHGLCLDWNELSVSDNKWSKNGDASVASSNRVYVPVLTKGGDSMDALSGKNNRNSSYASFHSLSASSVDDSDGDNAVSVKFSGSDTSLDGSQHNTQEKMIGIGGLNLLNMIGGGKIQSVRDIVSSRVNKNPADEVTKIPDKPLTSNQQINRIRVTEDSGVGSNAQTEDDSNYDDPFETWSAPGDVKREEHEQNWLQRGIGGLRRDSKIIRQNPQANQIIEPFNSCNGEHNSDARLESFDSKGCSSSKGGDYIESAMQDRKSFGFFKGLGKGR